MLLLIMEAAGISPARAGTLGRHPKLVSQVVALLMPGGDGIDLDQQGRHRKPHHGAYYRARSQPDPRMLRSAGS